MALSTNAQTDRRLSAAYQSTTTPDATARRLRGLAQGFSKDDRLEKLLTIAATDRALYEQVTNPTTRMQVGYYRIRRDAAEMLASQGR